MAMMMLSLMMTMMVVMFNGDEHDPDGCHALNLNLKSHPRRLACLRLRPGPCSPETEKTFSMVSLCETLPRGLPQLHLPALP